MEESVSRRLEQYRQQRSIQISLDSVLFSDGTAVGPDSAQWIDKWRAEIDAFTLVWRTYVDSSADEARAALIDLAQPAFRIHRESEHREPLNYTVFQVMAEHAPGYAQSLDLYKGYYAIYLLNQINEAGDEVVRKPATQFSESAWYPPIRRKEKQ